MLSAGHFPIVMFGTFHLPPILPANPEVFAVLRQTHTMLAYLLFFTFLAHMGAVLFHTLVLRDGILSRMLPWSVPDPKGQVEQKPLKRCRELRGFKEKTTPAGIKLWWKS